MGYKNYASGILLAAFLIADKADAQSAVPNAPQSAPAADTATYINQFHLAYVRTSSEAANYQSAEGLKALSAVLAERTSAQPSGVKALDIEKDEILFFPFIYWPVNIDAQPLSENAQKKLQSYLDTGGVVLFDVRNQVIENGTTAALKRILGNVGTEPLAPMGKEHTLGRAFYLASDLPGTRSNDPVWVEVPATGKEKVTSLIIGNHDWAGAWSGMTVVRDSKAYEEAMWSGVNMVMYALTGNYKADAAHIPSILEKLKPR